jgi:hypothetical protein
MRLWIRDGSYFDELRIEVVQSIPVKGFRNHEWFRDIWGKFDPFTRFLSSPIRTSHLSFRALKDLSPFMDD